MNIVLDQSSVINYKSNSQKIRVLTEEWVDREIFCPNCGNYIDSYENNRPVADFFCSKCREEYELKSKNGNFVNKINDGAYRTMIERLSSDSNPNFFLLDYDKNYLVNNFFVVPKHFFIPEIIEKRKPLADTAKRAGWIGCNILLKTIPQGGKIFYIQNKKALSKSIILDSWQKTLFLKEQKEFLSRGWILDVMNCVDSLGKKEFKLDEIYNFEEKLKIKYPNNNHIKDKIRQQLQFLRDRGYLEFVSRGIYRLS